ncbi:MAG: DUF2807 domain-containing protein [Bacteroidales bacterium]|nr:DUF2807 domain-containing protein [Bacteroidales bacterium]
MMNTVKGLLFLLAVTGLSLFSCEEIENCVDGTEEVVRQEIDLNDFEGLELSNEADVLIMQGNKQKVEVESHQNIINNLELDVDNKKLYIGNNRCVQDYEAFRIYITIPYIDEVNISGSGDVQLAAFSNFDRLQLSVSGSGDLSSKGQTYELAKLELAVSGSGDIDLNASAGEIVCEGISGSGDVYLGGSTDAQSIQISGSGNYKAFRLASNTADVVVSGSGDCEVNVSQELAVDISGSGNVYYKGNPSINTSITGTGELIDAN